MRKPLGNTGRHLPRYRQDQPTNQAIVDEAVGIELEAPVTIATAPGDTRKLRGIPAIGYGVAGAIPGTAPHLTKL
jgi:hypothetical protein